MADNRSGVGPTGLEDTGDSNGRNGGRRRSRRGKKASGAQVRHWRLVPTVGVLPAESRRLPPNFLLRSLLVVAIGLLALLGGARYLDWNNFDDRALAAQTRTASVNRQLTTRQSEIEPLQTQINLLALELESAETIYQLATEGQADWFAAMSGLFDISVSGVEFLSGTIDSNGKIALVGVATDADAIASLPTQLSQLAGVVDLQGIQWDAEVSPPRFSAEFQVSR